MDDVWMVWVYGWCVDGGCMDGVWMVCGWMDGVWMVWMVYGVWMGVDGVGWCTDGGWTGGSMWYRGAGGAWMVYGWCRCVCVYVMYVCM